MINVVMNKYIQSVCKTKHGKLKESRGTFAWNQATVPFDRWCGCSESFKLL